MNLGGKKLDDWFLSAQETKDFSKFPHGEDHPTKYKTISDQLYKWVHPEVGVGSVISDNSLLTNHGSDHIKTLIGRATQFVENNPFCTLSPFEVYLLLMAIHVHDVGNILGRQGHDFNAQVITEKLKVAGIVGQDDLTWDYIYRIAVTHKGYRIDLLPDKDYLYEIPFRPRLLAGMLKFADELAENFSRASKINVDLGNVPKENLLYHVFACAINSIVPDPDSKEITMIFNVDEEQLSTQYQKDKQRTFLIDEIYLRTLKTYSEKVYCLKFLRPYVNFETIKVTININRKDGTNDQIGYELTESPIKDICPEEIFRICPELKSLTGALLVRKYGQRKKKAKNPSKKRQRKINRSKNAKRSK